MKEMKCPRCRAAIVKKLAARAPHLYGEGLKNGQSHLYPALRGSFGPYGNLRENGCGAFAAHNVLTLLGCGTEFSAVADAFNRNWFRSTVFFGKLGANPFYVNRLIKNGSIKTARYFIVSPKAARKVGRHEAYLALYFWKGRCGRRRHIICGAHYQALSALPDGRLEAFNDPHGVYADWAAFYKASDAAFMFVFGYDRSARKTGSVNAPAQGKETRKFGKIPCGA